MKFSEFLENSIQQLFPFMTEEEPLDWKKIARYKDRDSYIKAKMKGGKKTEAVAEKMVSAPINSFWAGKEEILNIWNDIVIIPETKVTFALVKNLNENFIKYRLLAYYGKVTRQEILTLPIIGGITFSNGHILCAWVDSAWRSTTSLFKEIREFARKYLGVHNVAPDDDLTSKSYRASEAKREYDRFIQYRQSF